LRARGRARAGGGGQRACGGTGAIDNRGGHAALRSRRCGPAGHARAWFGSTEAETPVYARAELVPGDRLEGPAIVAQLDTTTLVPPGWRADVDGGGNL